MGSLPHKGGGAGRGRWAGQAGGQEGWAGGAGEAGRAEQGGQVGRAGGVGRTLMMNLGEPNAC